MPALIVIDMDTPEPVYPNKIDVYKNNRTKRIYWTQEMIRDLFILPVSIYTKKYKISASSVYNKINSLPYKAWKPETGNWSLMYIYGQKDYGRVAPEGYSNLLSYPIAQWDKPKKSIHEFPIARLWIDNDVLIYTKRDIIAKLSNTNCFDKNVKKSMQYIFNNTIIINPDTHVPMLNSEKSNHIKIFM